MALVGGGGAGNTAGSNPAGVGSTLNFVRIGDISFAYAYSGEISNAAGGQASKSTMLDFTTGSSTINCEVTWGIEWAGTDDIYLEIEMDGQSVYTSNYKENSVIANLPIKLIIPPFTRFKALWGIDNVTKTATVMLAGRAYA